MKFIGISGENFDKLELLGSVLNFKTFDETLTKILVEHESIPKAPMLRDLFAITAMNGLLLGELRGCMPDYFGGLSEMSYQIADAMMKAREK